MIPVVWLGRRRTSIWPLFTDMKRPELNAAGDKVDQELELCRDTVESQRMNVRPDMPEDALEAVIARLDGAMTRVEGAARAMRTRVKRAELAAIEARDADADRAHLAETLDQARGREAALQEAAQFASDTLDGAIAELRDLLLEED
jgi:Domain of unknown function (DUF4164)